MSFPAAVDAFVPRDFKEFTMCSKTNSGYISLSTLQSIALDAKQIASRDYASRIEEPTLYRHCERSYLFGLAIVANGFPSGTPGVPQIPFAELQNRLFHANMLHDVGLAQHSEVVGHPAHAMSFELHGGVMAYEHLRSTDASIDSERLGDIVQSIMTHTLTLPRGSTTAVGMLLQLGALFDVLGYDAFGEGSLNSLVNRRTVQEVLKAYPRGELGKEVAHFLDMMGQYKPHCLVLAGLPGFAERAAASVWPVDEAEEKGSNE
ncbi:hypothetical protein EWM64_g4231 [Hericium alpestre]|uniref:HD domain-containing protein n=1 Tax=Hericium alpestre TaxID=135208 RepID=A0A4Z0A0D7_9AGAM|nr:hypothetical protein EWM64_g4231 [Hericium alpestre]